MRTFEWQGVIRVSVGELTRKQTLQFANEMNDLYTTSRIEEIQAIENQKELDVVTLQVTDAINEIPTVLATRKIEVCKDGQWIAVGAKPVPVELDGMPYEVALPITRAWLNDLPASLYKQWIGAVGEENAYLLQSAPLESSTAPSTPTTSA